MSGFCLDHYHFITAAHYLMDASPQERTDSIANMQNPNVQGIAISINRTSMQMLKYIQGELFESRLYGDQELNSL